VEILGPCIYGRASAQEHHRRGVGRL
jgi:hypothetical protein